MTAIEIKAKEQELITEINSDVNLLDSAIKYVRKLKKTQGNPPCLYTVEELKVRLKKGRVDAKKGLYKTQSEMRNKYTL